MANKDIHNFWKDKEMSHFDYQIYEDWKAIIPNGVKA